MKLGVDIFPNWSEICKIHDMNLRMALGFCSDGELVEKLHAVFPQCYSVEETLPKPIPKSVLIEMNRKAFQQQWGDEGYDEDLLCGTIALSIPVVLQFHTESGWGSDNLVPEEILGQMRASKAAGESLVLKKVSYRGSEFLLVQHELEEENRRFTASLILSEYVDLNT